MSVGLPPAGTILSVITELTTVGSTFDYKTYYDELKLLEVFISESVFTEGGVSFIEGEGGARYNDTITCRVENGNLIIDGHKALQYSLNSNGDLIYTY